MQLWSDRMESYLHLQKMKQGLTRFNRNVLRTAERREIPFPALLTVEQCQEGYNYARARKCQLRTLAPGLRKVHLRNCQIRHELKGDEAAAKGVKAAREQEAQKKMWFFIRRSQNDPRAKSIMTVQKQLPDGTIVESATKEETEEMIFGETEYRFQLAKEAPISNTTLLEQL